MFNNSNELLDYALRELQVAVQEEIPCIEITLDYNFSGNSIELCQMYNDLKIKAITEILREEFSNYIIEGGVCTGKQWKVSDEPEIFEVVWILNLQKK